MHICPCTCALPTLHLLPDDASHTASLLREAPGTLLGPFGRIPLIQMDRAVRNGECLDPLLHISLGRREAAGRPGKWSRVWVQKPGNLDLRPGSITSYQQATLYKRFDPRPWGSPGKNTGVGCHFLLQCMKVKRESVQAGFRKGRGTRDQIANIRWIIEKAREFQKNTLDPAQRWWRGDTHRLYFLFPQSL